MNFLNENKLKLEQLMPLITESLGAGKSVRFMPMGTSMLPMFRQGKDSVVISPLKGDIRKYDIPFYKRENGQYVLHRAVSSGDTFICIGDNQYVYEYGVKKDQVIGVVTEFYRGDRKYSTDSFVYKVYCRAWHYSRRIRKVFLKIKNKIKRMTRT